MKTRVAATQIETKHFLWHCAVAALLIEKVPSNTATNAHVLNAIRKASVAGEGKNGVRYATKDAIATKAKSGGKWDKCGLLKEHVVPVGEIHRRVIREWANQPAPAQDLGALLASGNLAAIQEHPRVALVADIVREWTLLAWVTRTDDDRLRDRDKTRGESLHKSMPKGWNGEDKHARYQACGIELEAV